MIDNLKLLKGEPIFVEGIGNIHPLKLKEIVDMGLDKYNLYILATTFNTKNTLIQDWFKECEHSNELCELMCWALSLCLKDGVYFYKDLSFNTVQDGSINNLNYLNFVNVIKAQYCLGNLNENEEEIYSDEKAREIAEKIKKFRDKIKNSNNENATTLKDMISSISARHPSINLFNIWDLTIYQLYDQFKRLNLVDNYNNSIFLLPHSEEAGKNLKHWSTILKEDDS